MIVVMLLYSCDRSESIQGTSDSDYNRDIENALGRLQEAPDSALSCLLHVADATQNMRSKAGMENYARALEESAYIYYFQFGDFFKCHDNLVKAFDIYKKTNNSFRMAKIKFNLGNILIKKKAVKKAIKYYEEALELAFNSKDSMLIRHVAVNLFFQNFMETEGDIGIENISPFVRKLKESGDTSNYAMAIYKLMDAVRIEDYNSALDWADTIENNAGDYYMPEVMKYMSDVTRSKIYVLSGHPYEAAELIKDKRKELFDDQRVSADLWLSQIYESCDKPDSVMKYRLSYYTTKDSLPLLSTYVINKSYMADDKLSSQNAVREDNDKYITLFLTFIVIICITGPIVYYHVGRKSRNNKDNALKITVRGVGSSNESENINDIMEKIDEVMHNTDEVFKPDFSIAKLSSLSGIHYKKISKCLHDERGVNFSTFLQDYRIKEVKCRLASTAYSQYTIEAIAIGVGFRSRTNFAHIFKKHTGMTPSEYRSNVKN